MPSKFLIGMMITFILACVAFVIIQPITKKKIDDSKKATEEKIATGKIMHITALPTTCRNQKTYYTELENKRVYLSCLEDVEVEKKGGSVSLKKENIEEIVKNYHTLQKQENKMSFYIGKTGLSDVSIIVCENGDLIFGASDMTIQPSFCKRTCNFTRTYYVINAQVVEDHYRLTLTGKNAPILSVTVPKNLMTKYEMNGAYEFTFEKEELDDLTNATDQMILDTYTISKVQIANKTEDMFIQEPLCKVG